MNLVADRSNYAALGGYKSSFNSLVTVKVAGGLRTKDILTRIEIGQSVLLDCYGPTLRLRARVLRHEGQSTVGGAAWIDRL